MSCLQTHAANYFTWHSRVSRFLKEIMDIPQSFGIFLYFQADFIMLNNTVLPALLIYTKPSLGISCHDQLHQVLLFELSFPALFQ
jgi:hypothetical protein